MSEYYLAVDIGASSGRHILGSIKDGKIVLEEVYRFENRQVLRNGQLCWDTARLFEEIVAGMRRCKELGKIPKSVGIDTWGVDFVLLDGDDRVVGDTVAYRDRRTQGMDTEVYGIIPARELYERTGIQMQVINTIYQLYSLRRSHPQELARARRFLMIPDYFNFLLTGVKMNEYTNATTTQLVSASRRTWDTELIRRLGLPAEIFGELNTPKTLVGPLRREIGEKVGFSCEVVLAAPESGDDFIYLSSGTWSLIGIERREPDCGVESFRSNFTNEGGFDYRFRYLKNIMGLWVLQSIRHELGDQYSFDELCAQAAQSQHFETTIDINDPSLLSPQSMIGTVTECCKKEGKTPPDTTGELAACVYNSLAASYWKAVEEIERVTHRQYGKLHLMGGGTKDAYLNRLTAEYTGKEVYAGPTEATAIGNLLAQMLRTGEFADIGQARECVARSFDIKRIDG